MGDGTTLNLTANLSSADITRPAPQTPGTPIWGGEAGEHLSPWSVFWRIGG
jgi:maltooligosyltrehalose trehalohydrolase